VSYVERGEQYARDVLAGEIPACELVRLSCQRYFDDLERKWEYEFDEDRAERACKFYELFPHTKGKWARASNNLMRLEPWQIFIEMNLMGWVHKDTDYRRFRRSYEEVPRKNGKSDRVARRGLYTLAADHEFGAEVYSGATTEKQAWEVFRPARLMAMRTPGFLEHYGVEVNAKSVNLPEDGSRFEPIIGNPGDGASPSHAIVDEYHEHKTAALYDTMETGMGAREQPLLSAITTAGDNLGGPCYGLRDYAVKVLQGVVEDDGLFAMIYTIDDDTDWTSDLALRMANPNYGVSVQPDYLKSQQQTAINDSRKQGTFKTKHLNVWVGARDAFFNLEAWRACSNEGLRLEDFTGQRCVMALDLASKVDIAALELMFPLEGGSYARFGKYYLPRSTVSRTEHEHYKAWETDGWLTVTEGNITDYDKIKEDILGWCSEFQVEAVGYDPHQATYLVSELGKEGVPCVEYRPTVLNFSEPMKQLDALMLDNRITHQPDPVMDWQVSNVVAKLDAKDNVYPRKEREENKIDNVVASIMCMGLLMTPEETETAVPRVRML